MTTVNVPAAQPKRLIPALLAAVVLLWMGLVLYGVLLVFEFNGPIAPGVTVGGVAVGGLTRAEAETELDRAWNNEHFIGLGSGLLVHPLELGLFVDPVASARAAWDVGRGGNRWGERIELVFSPGRAHDVTPLVIYSEPHAREGLLRLAERAGTPGENARVEFTGGRWLEVPARAGQSLDVEATLAQLSADPLSALLSGTLPAQYMPIQPEVTDVSALVAELEARRTTPLVIHGYDPITDETLEWQVTPEVFSAWIRVEAGADAPAMTLDPEALQGYLSTLPAGERTAALVSDPAALTADWQAGRPLRAVLKYPPSTYIVQPGDTLLRIGWNTGIPFWMIVRANPGLNADAIYAGQELTIPSKSDLLPLPPAWGKRVVISIGEQRMWVYENGTLRSEWVISTGIDRSPTQPGVFQVQTRDLEAYASVWDLYMPHFLGIYEAWPGFMNGIHGLPTLSSGRRLWEGALGKPASYGCIILPLAAAEELYNWAEDGTVVEIRE